MQCWAQEVVTYMSELLVAANGDQQSAAGKDLQVRACLPLACDVICFAIQPCAGLGRVSHAQSYHCIATYMGEDMHHAFQETKQHLLK